MRPENTKMPPARLAVLAVEDDENDALLFKLALEEAGLQAAVHFVCDGTEAIDYLQGTGPYADRESHPLPNLLVMDLKMPRLDGCQVIKWLRRQQRFDELFVAVLSGSCCEKDFRLAYSCGADLCVQKPLRFDKLSDVVKHLGGRYRAFKHSRVSGRAGAGSDSPRISLLARSSGTLRAS
jgi:CheY-like chemotaxis protein